MTDWTDPLVIATAGLTFSPLVLTAFAILLWKTTRRLARIEDRRDKAESRHRRYARLAWKVELAERILAADRARFLPPVDKSAGGVYRGRPGWTTPEARQLRHFARLLDYERDGIGRDLVDGLVKVLDAIDHDSSFTEQEMDKWFLTGLAHLRDRLALPSKEGKESILTRWRVEMDELASGEELPPGLGADYGEAVPPGLGANHTEAADPPLP